MSYQYDIFLSYNTEFPFGEWVRELLIPFLKPFIENTINREVKIFHDRDGILTGDSWSERLKSAIAHSRCMVAVWSPSYFNSEWCMKECAVMLNREEKLGYRTVGKPNGLIVPVCIFDGQHFPEFAKKIQYRDCRDYARVGEGFKRTTRYIEFQDSLIEWVPDIVESINGAPEWAEEWLTDEWLDDIIGGIEGIKEYRFEKPSLG